MVTTKSAPMLNLKYTQDEYSKKLQKPKGANGLKKLLVFASVVLLASISVYYAKRRNVA